MSSAAKLRHIGRGTAVVASAALVMTSFGPAAFASWDDAPQTSIVDSTQTDGTIGIVDTEPGSPTVVGSADPKEDNQGATLVQAGKTGQAIGDVRFTLPNRFASGDILDLKLLDRSATEHSDGLANQSADTLVGFSGVEGVTIEVSQAMDPRTTVDADTDAVDTASPRTEGNTETSVLGWTAGTNTSANPLRNTAPSAAPAFNNPVVTATAANQGKDNLRLQVNNRSTGDPDAVWVVTIKGLKVDLGAKATPGELRIVPFLSNTVASGGVYTSSPWFNGNTKEDNNGTPAVTGDDTPREIGIYTVPAYVSPVTVTSSTQRIIADGTAQSVGDVKITETQPFSLQNGTYTVDFSESGADVTIESAASAIKAAITGGGANETVGNVTVANDKKSLTFTVAGADNATSSTITLSGLMLKAERSGDIAFNITGGSMSGTNSWLASPAGTSTLTVDNPSGADIYVANALLNPSATPANNVGEVDRTINQALAVPASTAPTATVGPPSIDAAATGENILASGNYVVNADATTITGGGVVLAGTPTANADGSVSGTYTIDVPGQGENTAETYVFSNILPGETLTVANERTVAAETSSVTEATPATGAGSLPVGQYTVTAGTLTTDPRTLTGPGGISLTETGDDSGVFGSGADAVTLTGLAPDTPAGTSVNFSIASAPTATGTGVRSSASIDPVAATPNAGTLPNAQYTVSANGATITGGGVTLTRQSDGTYRVTNAGGTTAAVGDDYTFTGIANGATYQVAVEEITTILGGTVTIDGVQNLGAGTYTVTANGDGTFAIDGDATLASVRNGVQVAVGGQPVTFYGLADDQTFTVEADALLGDLDDYGVNQKDILAPVDEFTQFGSASSGTSAVGGANRFETARKIAKMYSPRGDYAIVASGVNFPDALSSGYLSQRMDAPILLVDKPGLAIPEDTLESLRERGVRKVFIVGGTAAVGQKVEDALKASQSYMYDEAAGNLRPRGSNLEVQRIGGNDRFGTNSLVNMYAAAQFDKDPSIGRTPVGYGQPLKTTAMVARADDFADALTANVLTAGRGGQQIRQDATGGVVSFARGFGEAAQAISATDLQKFAAAGEYRFLDTDADGAANTVAPADLVLQRNIDNVWTTVATTADGRTYTGNSNATLGSGTTVTFATIPTANSGFALAISPVTAGTYTYASDPATRKGNALPVILTDKDGLNPAAEAQIKNLHVEHTLLIGSENAVSASVDSSITALKNAAGVDLNVSTRRLGGTDRYDTAKVVNEYAMDSQVSSSATDLPGLGYDGRRTYDAATNRPVSGEHTVYLANGGVRLAGATEVRDPMRFADALVAGPWISAEREAMALVGVVSTPNPTTAFYNENRDRLDRAVGLGLGQAVSTKVIEFANQVVSGSLRGEAATPAPTGTATP